MGAFDSLGGITGGIGSSLQGVGTGVFIFFVALVMIIISGIIVFAYYWKKSQKLVFRNKIHIFKEVNGKRLPLEDDVAKELFVPDTNISLFYLKKRKIYIARPTKAMGIDSYWYLILPNGEWVNIDISGDSDDPTKSKINYDHRDTRYAYINLREIIKRNWRDKSVTWWKEYSPLITFVVVSFIFIVSCWFLIRQIRGCIEILGPIAKDFKVIAESLSNSVNVQQNLNSGIVSG